MDKPKPNQEACPKNIKHARRKPSQVQAATAVFDVNFMRPTGLPSTSHHVPGWFSDECFFADK